MRHITLHPAFDPWEPHVFVPARRVAVVVYPKSGLALLVDDVGGILQVLLAPLHQYVVTNAVWPRAGHKQQPAHQQENKPAYHGPPPTRTGAGGLHSSLRPSAARLERAATNRNIPLVPHNAKNTSRAKRCAHISIRPSDASEETTGIALNAMCAMRLGQSDPELARSTPNTA